MTDKPADFPKTTECAPLSAMEAAQLYPIGYRLSDALWRFEEANFQKLIDGYEDFWSDAQPYLSGKKGASFWSKLLLRPHQAQLPHILRAMQRDMLAGLSDSFFIGIGMRVLPNGAAEVVPVPLWGGVLDWDRSTVSLGGVSYYEIRIVDQGMVAKWRAQETGRPTLLPHSGTVAIGVQGAGTNDRWRSFADTVSAMLREGRIFSAADKKQNIHAVMKQIERENPGLYHHLSQVHERTLYRHYDVAVAAAQS